MGRRRGADQSQFSGYTDKLLSTINTAINSEMERNVKSTLMGQAIQTYTEERDYLFRLRKPFENIDSESKFVSTLNEEFKREWNRGAEIIATAKEWIAKELNSEAKIVVPGVIEPTVAAIEPEPEPTVAAIESELTVVAKELRRQLDETTIEAKTTEIIRTAHERAVALQKFDAKLEAFKAQIELLSPDDSYRYDNASEGEQIDLERAYSVGIATLAKLKTYRDNYVCDAAQTKEAFAQLCLTALASEENKELNNPRGDWSIGRILGELIRSLKSLVVTNPTAPRFFETTTQKKAKDIAGAVRELNPTGPRAGG